MDNRQQKLRAVLARLKLTAREIDVFFILLEQGATTAADLAKRTRGIPRTSVYDLLKMLQQKGLVSSFVKNDKMYFRLESIEHIVDSIEDEKRELTDKQNDIRGAADIFRQLKSGTAYEPGTRFFEGKPGILAIHRELQNARTETRTIVDVSSVYRVFPRMVVEDNLKDFQTYKIIKKDLMIKSRLAERYLRVAPLNAYHMVKWLPPDVIFKTDTLIWDGHIAIIDYTERLSGVIIDNPAIAATFVAWFEMMWRSINDTVR